MMVNSSEKDLATSSTKSFVNSFQMIYVLFQKVLQVEEINMEVLMETVKYMNDEAMYDFAKKKKNEQEILQTVIKSLMLDMFKEVSKPFMEWEDEPYSNPEECTPVLGSNDQLLDDEEFQDSQVEECDGNIVSTVNSASSSENDESRESSVIGEPRQHWQKELHSDSSEDTFDQLNDYCFESNAGNQPTTKSTLTHELLVVLPRLTMPTTSVPRFQQVTSPSTDSPSTSEFTFTSSRTAENTTAVTTGTAEKYHICSVCGRSFLQKMSLVLHSRTHVHEENISTCSICGSSFSHENLLLQHIRRSHSENGSKVFVCTFCEERFTQKGHLARHMRTHGSTQGESVCFHCGKRFVSLRDMVEHRRMERDKCTFRANARK